MTTMPPTLLQGHFPTRVDQLDALFDAWLFAAHEATEALHAWAETHHGERATAHAVYRAALDREESAADALMVASVLRR